MEIIDYIKMESCEVDLKAKNKDEALKKIAEIIGRAEILEDIGNENIYQALKKREETGTTGFKNGIAIPHCQMDEVDEFVIGLAISKKGIDFESLDGEKSNIFAIIIGPKGQQKTHLQLLAKISNELKKKSVCEELVNSNTKLELYENFIRNSSIDNYNLKKGKDKLMILVVSEEELLQDITEIFLQFDITQATIMESKQMENILSDIPLFMGFFDFTGSKTFYNNIIFVKINERKINAVIDSIEDIVGDLENYRGLSLFVLDLMYSKGVI